MNIFKSLLGKVWQDPNAAEVVKIEMGQLYLVRPGNIRSSRECIYNEAIATIRRVPALEHNFQLVITRVYEDGDQELLEDEDETDEERVFLISEELEFRSGVTDDEPTFIWRDLDGDVDELYEFVASGTNEPTRVFFETCMYRAMYERKYKASADNTKDSALDQFIWQPVVKARGKGGNRKAPKNQQDSGDLSSGLQDSVDDSTAQPQVMPTKPASPAVRVSFASSSLPTVTSEEGQLFFWNLEAEGFVAEREGVVVAKIVERTPGDFNYWFIVTDKDGDIVSHKISSDMNPRWAPKTSSLTWNYSNHGRYDSWALQLTSPEAYNAFKTAFAQCLWETLHGIAFRKAKPDEQAYVISSTTEDVEMRDVEDEVDDEEEVESELDPDEEASEEEEEDEEDDSPPQLQGERNSQLTIGYKGDRSYVVRGNNIGVFSHSRDDQVKYYATISKISTPKGKEFKPREVMLHDQDTKMVLMNPSDPHSLFSMDIERGKVVEEWKIHEDISVDHMAPDNKFAQTTREQTLVGASHNALFRVDPRISGNKMVESQYKQYVSKNKFSGVATTASGKLAVASEKGDIRLFDTIGKNAKTALPPLGDPILGIDVTASGRWIVATTKTYLLLIDTLIGEGRYAGNLGFDRSFPANAKPMPRRLQLRSEHVAYMNHDISFSVARFNQGEGQEENAIVTATGQYVIAWDFAKVKKGQLDKYEIKKYEDMVVQDNFKFGDDKQIIVALQNNVLAINKKNLKRPTRVSLAAPMSSLRSRSSIVDSPY
ncbi:VID27 cytoplasmic protein-domain-containing protein [Suillus paluster]|uniref:VID27 cytoplasmic protein-domain-containing protein n=1 Tax=Suillus paluster TaxID=48578 RepID=UPI001B86DD9F|nr:VID27 cytoplasmic protein-domain-containing protein [Suillus paluster]KAG1752734.1 VID27 cytoplasmic protein-domain-containing protein [Suillus paluster]